MTTNTKDITIYDLIRDARLDAVDTGPDGVTKVLMDRLALPEIVYPAIRSFVLEQLRAATRAVEVEAFKTAKPDIFSPEEHTVFVDRRTSLSEETFYTGERYVKWSEATVKDHEARIAYLKQHITGYVATIQRHKTAIAEIRAAGVRCLGELKG